MSVIPIDVWKIIAQFAEPDPLVYTSWAHVCKASRAVFFQDSMWLKFSPVATQTQLAVGFHERIGKFSPQTLQVYRNLLADIFAVWRWKPNLVGDDAMLMQILRVVMLKKEYYMQAESLKACDYTLMCEVWLHMVCVVWWPETSRYHSVFANIVHQRTIEYRNRDFVLAATRLYGPLLRYIASEFRDDKEIILNASRYQLLPLPHVDYEDEWTRWRVIPPYDLISDRLKCDKEVALAYISRWPVLLEHLPAELQNDPDIRAVTQREKNKSNEARADTNEEAP